MKRKFTTATTLLTLLSVLALATPATAGKKKLKLKSNSVASKHIKNGNVTAAKIAGGAVGPTHIQAGAVAGAHIQNGAVTAAKLSPDVVAFQSPSGTDIFVNPTGNVGIGTDTPTQAILVVSGNVASDLGGYASLTNVGDVATGFIPPESSGPVPRSIFTTGAIAGSEFHSFSDQRIKTIIGQSDSKADLDSLMKIEITDYKLIDQVAKGTGSYKKVIAQQVEEFYPQAVSQSTDVVPDIFKTATMVDGWVSLETDLQVGDQVRLLGETENGIHEVLEVRDGAFRTAFQPEGEKVFVYGREVDDFRSVDYEAIAMLNVSATQEMYRRNVALEQRVAALEAENELRDAKLTAIEAMLEKNGANFASLKTVAAAK